MRINVGGVNAYVEGFRPLLTLKVWLVARRMKKNPAFERRVVEELARRGAHVTLNGERIRA